MPSIRHNTAIREVCVLCNRETRTGQRSPVGPVGPDCARKIAALPDLLRAAGMPELIDTGLVEVQAVEEDGRLFPPERVRHFIARLNQSSAGLGLQRVGHLDHSQNPPLVTFRLIVVNRKRFVKACRSFEPHDLANRITVDSVPAW